MPVRILTGPLWMMALLGVWILAVAYGRRDVWGAWPRRPFLIAACLVLVGAGLHAALFGSSAMVAHGAGSLLLMACALCAFLGARARARAALLRGSRPTSLDEAVAALRAGKSWGPGVLRGRLAASGEVASPGGILCAGYEAELRVASVGRAKGALLAVERAWARGVFLHGERCSARIALAKGSLWAPVRPTRCRESGRAVPETSVVDLASGPPEVPVVSHEKVAKLGTQVLVVGRLARGLAAGSYLIKGPRGGPAFLALEAGIEKVARKASVRAWALFALAAVLCLVAAHLLAT